MAVDASLLTKRGFILLRRLASALLLLALFAAGFWILNQTLDAVLSLHRSFVDLPFYPVPIDVWTYHDYGFALLWFSFVGFVFWETTPWKSGHLTGGRALISLVGFAVLTGGLWLSQDLMNAVLVLGRGYVDFPFFVERLDVWATRDVVNLLTSGGFVVFFTLIRVAG